jgi:hypothetical protein
MDGIRLDNVPKYISRHFPYQIVGTLINGASASSGQVTSNARPRISYPPPNEDLDKG